MAEAIVYQTIGSDLSESEEPRIAVIGIGGAGCRTVSMIYGSDSRVRTIAINTDRAALQQMRVGLRLLVAKDAELLHQNSSADDGLVITSAAGFDKAVCKAVAGIDLVIVASGMGGHAGTEMTPMVVNLCDLLGIKTTAIAVMPFSFESSDRQLVAADGYRMLHAVCKNLIQVKNDMVLDEPLSSVSDAMDKVNRHIVELITNEIEDSYRVVRDGVSRRSAKLREGADAGSQPLMDAPQVLGF